MAVILESETVLALLPLRLRVLVPIAVRSFYDFPQKGQRQNLLCQIIGSSERERDRSTWRKNGQKDHHLVFFAHPGQIIIVDRQPPRLVRPFVVNVVLNKRLRACSWRDKYLSSLDVEGLVTIVGK